MEEIQLTLTIEETNKIIKSLAQEPFKEVYELIGKINAQADEQIKKLNSISKEN
jgi:hypothetical protein